MPIKLGNKFINKMYKVAIKDFIYNALDYVQSNGNQALDTEYQFKSTHQKIEFNYTPINSGDDRVCGSYYYDGINHCGMIVQPRGVNMFEVGNTSYTPSFSVYTNTNYTVTLDADNGIFNVSVNENTGSGTYTPSAIITNLNHYIFDVNYNGTPNGAAMKLYWYKMYDDGVLVRDLVPARDKKGVVCMFDKVTLKYYYNIRQTTLTYGEDLGNQTISNVLVKSKFNFAAIYKNASIKRIFGRKGFVYKSVDSLFTSGGAILVSNYFDTNKALLIRRYGVNFETYDSDYTHSQLATKITSYSNSNQKGEVGIRGFNAAGVGDYIVVPNGSFSWKVDDNYTYVDNTTLAFPGVRYGYAGTSTTDYAFFGGGDDSHSGNNDVFTYDSNLTKTACSNLTQPVFATSGASVGNYALIGLGANSSINSNIINVYDNQMTKGTDLMVSQGRCEAVTAMNENCTKCYFCCGANKSGSPFYTNIDEVDENLTITSCNITKTRTGCSAAINGDLLIISGGILSGSTLINSIECVDTKTHTTFVSDFVLYKNCFGNSSITLGDSTIFFGGSTIASSFSAGYVSDAMALKY